MHPTGGYLNVTLGDRWINFPVLELVGRGRSSEQVKVRSFFGRGSLQKLRVLVNMLWLACACGFLFVFRGRVKFRGRPAVPFPAQFGLGGWIRPIGFASADWVRHSIPPVLSGPEELGHAPPPRPLLRGSKSWNNI